MDAYGTLLRHVLFPAWERGRKRPTLSLLAALERSQWLDRESLERRQLDELRLLLRHAYAHTRFYRDRLDAAGVGPDEIRTLADLARIPILDRDTTRASYDARLARTGPLVAVTKSTSGTTGEPTKVSYNAESQHWRDAVRWRGFGWGGYRMGMRSLHYWGAAPFKLKAWSRGKILVDHALKRETYLDCTPRGDDWLAQVVTRIESVQPEVIVTYAQAGADLARYVVRSGRRSWDTIPVLCGAERLFPSDRKVLEQAFGPAVFETYGCREFMLLATECEAHDGLHVQMENTIVEVLVREGDRFRAALPGEQGEVTVTDLHNLANPLIRYQTGDLAIARAPERCRCGRGLVRIGPIEGRVAETLRDGQGNPVSGLIFSIIFVALGTIARRFQAVQALDGTLTLKLVPDRPPTADDLARLREVTTRYLPGIEVKIEMVDDIPLTAAGKRRVVIVEKGSPAVCAAGSGQAL